MNSKLLSVGIDIGTSTTGMIASRLKLSNTALSYMVPKIDIVDKEIIYKSKIYNTPIVDNIFLDYEEIRKIISKEYKAAGIDAAKVDSGAVIITGEAALKENADSISKSLSEFAGEFVVATAGPDLESIISGKGSGAEAYSKENSCGVVNLDLGGGTTNISSFYCGELIGQTCVDIGGRLIKYKKDGQISYVSPRLNELASLNGFQVKEGMKVTESRLKKMTDIMAEVLGATLLGKDPNTVELMRTSSSSKIKIENHIKKMCFSGGVADLIYKGEDDLYKYNDLGVSLANSIRESSWFKSFDVIDSKETIRATVVGAGIYTTVVSGSTINYSRDLFPVKNIPALVVDEISETLLYRGGAERLTENLRWFSEQVDSQLMAMCFIGKKKASYEELCNMASSIVEAAEKELEPETPLFIITENDMAKSLGQTIEAYLHNKRDVVCIDQIKSKQGDYIDIGKPLMDGMALPIVVKTLVFK